MKEIIIVSHGTLAEGLIESGKVILGEMLEAKSCCLKMNMGIEDFKKEISKIIEQINPSNQIIVLADLKGGSPYTATLSVLDENDLLNKSVILTGVNLPLLINVVLKDGFIENEDIEDLINEGRDAISKFELIEDTEDDI